MPEATINQLTKDVSELQQNMAKVGLLVDRLDITIDKLAEVSAGVSKLLAVHELKITSQEEMQRETANLVEKRRAETESKVEMLHARISSGERELQSMIDDSQDKIMEELKEMRMQSAAQHKAMSDRITKMEKWMWMVVGGSIVVGLLLQKFPWATFFS